MNKCICCSKLFKTDSSFQNHKCVKDASKLPREELLKRLLESKGCSQEYYDAQIKLLKSK